MYRYVCEHVDMDIQVLAPTEARGFKSPGAGVTDRCVLPDIGTGTLNLGPLAKQQELLITEPSLHADYFLNYVYLYWCRHPQQPG